MAKHIINSFNDRLIIEYIRKHVQNQNQNSLLVTRQMTLLFGWGGKLVP